MDPALADSASAEMAACLAAVVVSSVAAQEVESAAVVASADALPSATDVAFAGSLSTVDISRARSCTSTCKQLHLTIHMDPTFLRGETESPKPSQKTMCSTRNLHSKCAEEKFARITPPFLTLRSVLRHSKDSTPHFCTHERDCARPSSRIHNDDDRQEGRRREPAQRAASL